MDFIGLLQYAKYCEGQIKAENMVDEVAGAMLQGYGKYMRLSNALHGYEWAISKSHWNWHSIFAYMIRGRVYDTFPIERLHRRVKPFARHIEHTECFERSVLTKLAAYQCKEGQLDDDVVLMGRTQPISHFATASLGPCARATNACNIEGELQMFSGDFI